jgi:hypothetical protein
LNHPWFFCNEIKMSFVTKVKQKIYLGIHVRYFA